MKYINKYFRILLCLMLSVVFLLSMSSIALADETEETTDTTGEEVGAQEEAVAEYVQVAKNQKMALYADMSNGFFYLENLTTGKKWYSVPVDIEDDKLTKGVSRTNMRSQIVVEYLSRPDEAWSDYALSTNSYSGSAMQDGISVAKIDSGIRVTYHFPAIDITVAVDYTLKDDHFNASIPLDQIKDDGEFSLMSVNLLPVFGAGNWEAEGQLLVPDGSGALIEFNNQVQMSNNYKAMIYGEELTTVPEKKSTITETVRLPVFGTITEGNALFGVVTQGDASAYITAVNGHARSGYNAVSSIFQYRFLQAQLNMFNKKNVNIVASPAAGIDSYNVRYYLLDGEQADFVGMATVYREYLIKEKGLTKQTSKPSFHVDALGFYEEEASILGIIPYTKKISLTTYEQAKRIAEELTKGGISSLTMRYIGWNNNGVTNVKIPKSATPINALGGKTGFAALTDYFNQQQYSLYPEADLLTFQKSGNGVSVNKNAIRTVFGKIVYRPDYILSNYVTKLDTDITAVLSPNKIEQVANTYLESLKKQGITTVSLGNLGDYCYANYYLKNSINRSLFPQQVEAVLKQYKEAGMAVSVSGGNAFTLPYVSLVTNVPISSSGYDVFDKDVPFYQTVLHGYVPYTTEPIAQTANPAITYLAAVENGSELLYYGMHRDTAELFDTQYNYYYGSTWTLWKDKAIAQQSAYQPLQNKVYDQVIVEHSEPVKNVFVTTYANGVMVAVNYNETEVVLDNGKTVPARGFIEWGENV